MTAQSSLHVVKAGQSKPLALVVDDEVDNLELLQRVLRKDYEVHTADSGTKALLLMEDHDFSIILTDQRMPKMLGTEFLAESLKRNPTAIRILITGYSDIESVIDAINQGSVHRYIKKPWRAEELRKEIETTIELQRLMVENQELVSRLKEANAQLREQEHLLMKNLDEQSKQLFRANKDLEALNETLRGLTLRDGLTGLYNHRGFQQRMREEFARAERSKHELTLIFFDIDHFKKYNDANGHPAGDDLLREIAHLLTQSSRLKLESARLRASDIVARYGGEEFVILLPETPLEGGRIKAERIRKSIESALFPHAENQPGGKVTVSVGVANFPSEAQSPQELIDAADQALYVSKRAGRNRTTLYRDLPQKPG
ncbi:MAG TPA: diguanylate cyclase, partial [Bdellovibrionota bacterium]|nr:diguanylate cyclase [Bdellovibrionota bacterium]